MYKLVKKEKNEGKKYKNISGNNYQFHSKQEKKKSFNQKWAGHCIKRKKNENIILQPK